MMFNSESAKGLRVQQEYIVSFLNDFVPVFFQECIISQGGKIIFFNSSDNVCSDDSIIRKSCYNLYFDKTLFIFQDTFVHHVVHDIGHMVDDLAGDYLALDGLKKSLSESNFFVKLAKDCVKDYSFLPDEKQEYQRRELFVNCFEKYCDSRSSFLKRVAFAFWHPAMSEVFNQLCG